MKRHSTVLLAIVVLLSSAAAQNSSVEKAAVKSANQWLTLVDTGKYVTSWSEAASLFKNSISKEEWSKMLRGTRAPLGKIASRKLKSAEYKTSLPGVPDGQYVVLQFDSSFEHKKSAVETVTPMLDKDGRWRVSGYYIK